MNSYYLRYYTYIKPVLKNKTVKTYSSLVFSIVAITILGLFALRPTLGTIVSLQKSIQERQEMLAQLKAKVDSLNIGEKNYTNLGQATVDKLKAALPESPALPKLMGGLSALAQDQQASISSLQFEPTEIEGNPKTLLKNAQIKEIPLTLNLQGPYPKLVSFLNELNQAERLITIDSINFNKSADGPLIMSIKARAYYLKN